MGRDRRPQANAEGTTGRGREKPADRPRGDDDGEGNDRPPSPEPPTEEPGGDDSDNDEGGGRGDVEDRLAKRELLEQSADDSDTRPGEQIAIILDKTNFYAEMGGQIARRCFADVANAEREDERESRSREKE